MSLGRMEAKTPVMRDALFTVVHHNSNSPVLNQAVHVHLGRRLRMLYDAVAEPLPADMQDLLAQIDAKLSNVGK